MSLEVSNFKLLFQLMVSCRNLIMLHSFRYSINMGYFLVITLPHLKCWDIFQRTSQIIELYLYPFFSSFFLFNYFLLKVFRKNKWLFLPLKTFQYSKNHFRNSCLLFGVRIDLTLVYRHDQYEVLYTFVF